MSMAQVSCRPICGLDLFIRDRCWPSLVTQNRMQFLEANYVGVSFMPTFYSTSPELSGKTSNQK
jgi:hypothetical protein